MTRTIWVRLALGIAVLGCGVVAANSVGGALFVIANKTNPFDVYATLWEWWGEYATDPAQRKALRGSLLISAVVCVVVPIVLLEKSFRSVQSLHGDARFASANEVRKAGLMGDTGIIVGKFMGRFLMLGGQLFALLAAPTRGGKGVGIVIPNLLNFPDSVVVLDVKQENFLITSRYRQLYGQACYLFNPFAEDGRTARWNPLSYVRADPKFAVADILAIGYVLFPNERSSKDAFFNDSARNLFLGLALYLVESPELPRTIGETLRQSSGKGKGLKQHLADLIEQRSETNRPLSETCVEAFQRFTSNSDNTLASILASFNAPLTVWANPVVDAATSGDDFLLTDVRRRRMTVYLGITPDKLSQSALILNLFFSQLINLNTRELPEANPELRYQCLLLMDEFTAMGKVDIVNAAVSYMAGYNLRLFPIIQSIAQLASKYGEQDAQTLATNHALKILFPPRENKDANEYSETLGYFTLRNPSRSISNQSMLPFKGAPTRGESYSDQRRALMMPQELRAMPHDQEIVTFENTRPILAEKILYYRETVFIDRLKEASASLRALDFKRWGWWTVRPIPTRSQLNAAIAAGELAIDVPRIDLDAHIAAQEARQRVALEVVRQAEGDNIGLDLEALVADFGDLPAVADPQRPTTEEVNALADAFFSKLEAGGGRPHERSEVVEAQPATVPRRRKSAQQANTPAAPPSKSRKPAGSKASASARRKRASTGDEAGTSEERTVDGLDLSPLDDLFQS